MKKISESKMVLDVDDISHGSIIINGVDMSTSVTGVDIHINAGEPTDVEVHFCPGRVIGSFLVRDENLKQIEE